MTKHLLAASALTFAAGAAQAGGILRDGDRSQILFQKGKNYVEASVSTVKPAVSGTVAGGALGSGNIAPAYQNYSFGYKYEVNDRLSFAIVTNEPVGADVDYAPGTAYPFSGSSAQLDSFAVTGLLKYNFSERISAYGGLRVQSMKGNVAITFPSPIYSPAAPYTLTVDNDYQAGFVLGAAYQIPKIALKIALTYDSEIEHEFRDNTTGTPFKVKIPQALTLHAQSGIAKDTLLFGSIRWQEWSKFRINPADYLVPLGNPPIASENSDILTYEIGIGRKFTENWSGAATLGYERDLGNVVGNLSGKEGFTSYGLAIKYETERWDITTGLKFFDLGSATTGGIGANFSDNSALAAGIKVGYRF